MNCTQTYMNMQSTQLGLQMMPPSQLPKDLRLLFSLPNSQQKRNHKMKQSEVNLRLNSLSFYTQGA